MKKISSFFQLFFLTAAIGAAVICMPCAADTEIAAGAASGSGKSVSVTPTPAPKPVKKKKKGKWVKKDGYCYYYTSRKKKLKKGVHEIGGKKYYFDEKGRQRTGWRKVGKHIYYFRCKTGKAGYMLAGRKVDGIRLKKNGRAAPKGTRAKEKLPLLIRVQKIVDDLVPVRMSKTKKLRIFFDYVKNHFKSSILPPYSLAHGNWDLTYLKYMLDHGSGDCVSYAVTFAYLANAAGFKDARCVNDGSHSWAEVDGKYYDPHWELWCKMDCFSIPGSMSGTGGRPDWAAHRYHIRNCDK